MYNILNIIFLNSQYLVNFLFQFVFSDIICWLYYDVVKGGISFNYKYIDCEFGDIVIWYFGDFCYQGIKWEMKVSLKQLI